MLNKIKKILSIGNTSKKIINAFEHNSLKHVNTKNSDIKNWKDNLENDLKFIQSIYNDVINLCQINNNSNILDMGCGTGVLVNKIKLDFPNAHVVGMDFSKSKIEQCKRFYNLDCFYTQNIYEEISEKFDIIICTEVLEHLNNPEQAIMNLLRNLNSFGKLLLTVPDGRNDNFLGHIHFWSPESWQLFISKTLKNCEEFVYDIGQLQSKNYAIIMKKD